MSRRAFVAYPGAFQSVSSSIKELCENTSDSQFVLTPWPKLDNIGLRLDELIRDRIIEAEFIVADITFPNFNVYYEVGFAIGSKKPVVPIINITYDKYSQNLALTALFDTLGQLRYQNSSDLNKKLSEHIPVDLSTAYIREKNHSQPMYIVLPLHKPEFINYTLSAVTNSFIEFRRFDPDENPRLASTQAIGEVSSSSGVIIPLLPESTSGALAHNLYAAFIAGLSHGLELEPLILQYEDATVPLDYREFVDTARTKREVEQAVEDYCKVTLIKNQSVAVRRIRRERSLLEQIDLGASAAENEHKRLDWYFVKTAQYSRAERSEGAIVVGRKGSGKSAIFYQVLAERSSDKRNLVIELNPSSHHLSELRENLLSVMTAGVYDHTMAAFWQYIIYFEIILKIREARLPHARFNLSLLNKIRDLETRFKITEKMVSGDFTRRLDMAVDEVLVGLSSVPADANPRQHLTNILFEDQIAALRDAVAELGTPYESITILFDNLDKGWPTRGIENYDVRTLRHLIETLYKVSRDLGRKEIELKHLLFLRSDVYDLLVEETSDRGKYNPIYIDWSDREQLQRVIFERIAASISEANFEATLAAANPLYKNGKTTLELLMDASLMRPRFLIDLYERTLVFAINRGHPTVELRDTEDALAQQSQYLINTFGLELRDVSQLSERLLSKFRGLSNLLTHSEVVDVLLRAEAVENADQAAGVIETLLWYGFLGFADQQGQQKYIYDLHYNMPSLIAECERQGDDLLYTINPAFIRGLEN